METHVAEWLGLLVRWVHIIAAIMWIGNSMLYNWMERNLRPGKVEDPSKFGELWMLHGGGFFKLEKFRAHADTIPERLFWFKWQSYTTWLSGFALLILVYFQSSGAFLLNPLRPEITYPIGISIALGFLVIGWLIYDSLWRLPLNQGVKLAVSFILLIVAAWGASELFSGRGAYLMLGAMLATFMSGNVFFHIIPSQKKMMAALESGGEQNMALAYRAKQRSIQNNYITFPVILAMMSNHYGMLYSHQYNWVILLVLMFMSALIRHFMNIRFHWKPWFAASAATMAAAAAILFGIFHFTSQKAVAAGESTDPGEPVEFVQAWAIVQSRCLPCHSTTPSRPEFSPLIQGVHFDKPEELKAYADRVKIRTVTQESMPLANITAMTPEERAMIGRWIDQGAKIN